MEGYYGRERAEVFTPDGWYRTGDLFHVDDDGFFYFHGRRGDMIKTAGANVSPREVEAALRERHRRSRVRWCSALPDAERDQVVGGGRPRRTGRRARPRQVRPDLRARLSAYKVPRRFLVLAPDDLPDAVERQARPAPRSSERFDER